MNIEKMTNNIPPIVEFLTKCHIKHRRKLSEKRKSKPKAIKLHDFFHNRLVPLMTFTRNLRKHKLNNW